MYIHELKKWPEFRWDHTKINEMLPPLRYKQGCLIGGMEAIGFALQSEAMLQILTQDVVKSSEIEGEILDQSLVRSSVARHLGMDIGVLDGIDPERGKPRRLGRGQERPRRRSRLLPL